eukprot:TRINITY_DN2696_c0_g1_i2.p1 TRINITY_DN2696_c0_g1~~TRINITY_DN2696_c0_g1_i2.p1  ORF type:complete len:396 (+),score=94.74 TRINITY_DN2696_c0_g1_i2:87-1274(+)
MVADGESYAAIPRVIWTLWFEGWDKAPELHRRCLESWRLYNQGWEVRPIARSDLPRLLGDFLPKYEKLRYAMNPLEEFGGCWIPPAAESDLLRVLLLHIYGGIWADSTMLCRRPLDEWLPEAAANGFFAYAPEKLEDNIPMMSSFLASSKGHLLTTAWRKRIEEHWSKPKAARLDLGFFWVHQIFGRMVQPGGPDSETSLCRSWEEVPRISGEYGVVGPHYWVEYKDKLPMPPTEEYRRVIAEDRSTPMWKLTNHHFKLETMAPSSCYRCILEDTRRHAHAHLLARAQPTALDGNPQHPLRTGMRVRCRGLAARPELNGCGGKLLSVDPQSARWQVQLEGGNGTKLLKADNLEAFGAACESRAAAEGSGGCASGGYGGEAGGKRPSAASSLGAER